MFQFFQFHMIISWFQKYSKVIWLNLIFSGSNNKKIDVLLFQGIPRLSRIYPCRKSYFSPFQRNNLKLYIICVHNKDYFMDRLVDGRLNANASTSQNTLFYQHLNCTNTKEIFKVTIDYNLLHGQWMFLLQNIQWNISSIIFLRNTTFIFKKT